MQAAEESGPQSTKVRAAVTAAAPVPAARLRAIEGTVFLHFGFAARQDQALGTALVQLVARRTQAGALSPFLVALALAHANNTQHRAGAALLERIRTAVEAAGVEDARAAASPWLASQQQLRARKTAVQGDLGCDTEIIARFSDVEATLVIVSKRSAAGWHHVTPGLVELGCMLLAFGAAKGKQGREKSSKSLAGGSRAATGGASTATKRGGGGSSSSSGGGKKNKNNSGALSAGPSATKAKAAATRSTGAAILQCLFERHTALRGDVLTQVLARAASRSAGAEPFVRLLGELVAAAPAAAVAVAPRIKDTLAYLSFLPVPAADALLRAVAPALRIDQALRDAAVIVLRKALFAREADARCVAVNGFVLLLETCCGDIPAVPVASASAAVDIAASELRAEIFGSLRRCLTQQTAVRSHLYRRVGAAAEMYPALAQPALELLAPQLHDAIVARPDALPPVRLHLAAREDGATGEPLGDLVAGISRLLRCVSVSGEIPQLAVSLRADLRAVATAAGKCDLEDWDMTKDQPMSLATAEGARNSARVVALLGVHEALLEALIPPGNEPAAAAPAPDVETANACVRLSTKRSAMKALVRGLDRKVAAESAASRAAARDRVALVGLLRLLLCDARPSAAAGLAVLRCAPALARRAAHALQEQLVQNEGASSEIAAATATACITALARDAAGASLMTLDLATAGDGGTGSARETGKPLRLLLVECLERSMYELVTHKPIVACQLVAEWPGAALCGIDVSGVDAQLAATCTGATPTLSRWITGRLEASLGASSPRRREASAYLGVLRLLCGPHGCLAPTDPEVHAARTWLQRACEDGSAGAGDGQFVRAMFEGLLETGEGICKEEEAEEAEEAEEEGMSQGEAQTVANSGNQEDILVLARDMRRLIGAVEDYDGDGLAPSQAAPAFKLLSRAAVEGCGIDGVVFAVLTRRSDEVAAVLSGLAAEAKITVHGAGPQGFTSRIKHAWARLRSILDVLAELLAAAFERASTYAGLFKAVRRAYELLGMGARVQLTACSKWGANPRAFSVLAATASERMTPRVYAALQYHSTGALDMGRTSRKDGGLAGLKIVPHLVYAIEQFERHLITLGARHGVAAALPAKRSSARDFRISRQTVQQAMAEAAEAAAAALEEEEEEEEEAEEGGEEEEEEGMEGAAGSRGRGRGKGGKRKTLAGRKRGGGTLLPVNKRVP